MPTLVHAPPGSVDRMAQCRPVVIERRVHRDRERAGLARGRALQRPRRPVARPARAGRGRCPGRPPARSPAPPPPGPRTAKPRARRRPRSAPARPAAPSAGGRRCASPSATLSDRLATATGVDRPPAGRTSMASANGTAHEVPHRAAPVARRRRRSRTWMWAAPRCSWRSPRAGSGSQRPHEIWNGTITRSPAVTPASSPGLARPPRRTRARARTGPGRAPPPRISQRVEVAHGHRQRAHHRLARARPAPARPPPATPPRPGSRKWSWRTAAAG